MSSQGTHNYSLRPRLQVTSTTAAPTEHKTEAKTADGKKDTQMLDGDLSHKLLLLQQDAKTLSLLKIQRKEALAKTAADANEQVNTQDDAELAKLTARISFTKDLIADIKDALGDISHQTETIHSKNYRLPKVSNW
jgi:hypothetical protein